MSYDVERRNKIVRESRRCTNCLHDSHTQSKCPSSFSCRHCHGRHHSLLHKDQPSSSTQTITVNSSFIKAQKGVNENKTAPLSPPEFYFIDTAIVNGVSGDRHQQARAALDSGSGVSLMSESLASHLKLPRYSLHIIVEGAYSGGNSKHFVQAMLQSLDDPSQSVTLKFSVIPKLKTSQSPHCKHDILNEPSLKNLKLADPDLGGPLDIIICSIDRCKCVTKEFNYFPKPKLAATKTIFGWTITGPLESKSSSPPVLQMQSKKDPLQKSLERLWEFDKVPDTTSLSPNDQAVVQHFHDTHRIEPDGRYVVELPRTADRPKLGESRSRAIQRFKQNEKSLLRKGRLDDFNAVLREYVELDHAELVPKNEKLPPNVFYLPVHRVFKESSTTTKLRAVFDASARSTNGVSLNDTLEAGPNLYPLLPDVLIRFRYHKIGLSADISKMFREILLSQKERNLHRFFMRDVEGQIHDYRMKRLTFGVKLSPYLATQVIRHIAESHSTSHPEACKAILEDFYVDNFLSGAETVEEAEQLRKQLCQLLLSAGMTLRKWRTSSDDLRCVIPEELIESKDLILTTPDAAPKALRVHWDVANDSLHISTPSTTSTDKITKRTIASATAKVFYIRGLFAPAIIPAKVLLQSLWKLPVKWDDTVPNDIQKKWIEWTATLPIITNFSIPRRMTQNDSPVIFRALHGFSDASSMAYGAAVYLRIMHENMTTSVSLITAKARVLPVKAITIPRAELTAAHLLAKLLEHVAKLLHISQAQIFAWTDSIIVLCWLQKPSSSLKTFVANRVSSIQEILPSSKWRHVPTNQNPADLLSRGMDANQLVRNSLWWNGPKWLAEMPSHWPTDPLTQPSSLPEIKVSCAAIQVIKPTEQLWKNFSSFHRLTRVIAWIRRFIINSQSARNKLVYDDILTSKEIAEAKHHLI